MSRKSQTLIKRYSHRKKKFPSVVYYSKSSLIDHIPVITDLILIVFPANCSQVIKYNQGKTRNMICQTSILLECITHIQFTSKFSKLDSFAHRHKAVQQIYMDKKQFHVNHYSWKKTLHAQASVCQLPYLYKNIKKIKNEKKILY